LNGKQRYECNHGQSISLMNINSMNIVPDALERAL
jgi:hypothetical protein